MKISTTLSSCLSLNLIYVHSDNDSEEDDNENAL